MNGAGLEVGIIHMNGRVYAPGLGRMLSPDPVTQAPENGQNYNRYSYVSNNPLKFTDPSGFIGREAHCSADGCDPGWSLAWVNPTSSFYNTSGANEGSQSFVELNVATTTNSNAQIESLGQTATWDNNGVYVKGNRGGVTGAAITLMPPGIISDSPGSMSGDKTAFDGEVSGSGSSDKSSRDSEYEQLFTNADTGNAFYGSGFNIINAADQQAAQVLVFQIKLIVAVVSPTLYSHLSNAELGISVIQDGATLGNGVGMLMTLYSRYFTKWAGGDNVSMISNLLVAEIVSKLPWDNVEGSK